MRFDQTVSARCRYSHVAEGIIGDRDVLFEDSEDDYSGNVYCVAQDKNGVVIVSYTYGSCNVCDDWEARNLTDAQLREEMERCTMRFTFEEFDRWVASSPRAAALIAAGVGQ